MNVIEVLFIYDQRPSDTVEDLSQTLFLRAYLKPKSLPFQYMGPFFLQLNKPSIAASLPKPLSFPIYFPGNFWSKLVAIMLWQSLNLNF